jgi:NADH:ubiquinone oxidoreductase subunit D
MAETTFLDSTELVLNMGPQHPSTHGVLRVILKLDGEKVNGTECVIGYLHRGVEKIGENRTYQQFAPYVDHGLRSRGFEWTGLLSGVETLNISRHARKLPASYLLS